MDKVFNKILIIDGSYAVHRALHVDSLFNLKTSKGERTGAIFQVLRMIGAELRICGDYFPVVCFDEGLAPRRLEADSHYKKANEREDKSKQVLTKEELDNDYVTQYRKQRNKLIEVLMYLGIPCLKFIPWEGDDLMYILSKMANESVILTDDRDLLQLLSDNCKVRRPMADEIWDLDSFLRSRTMNSIYDFILWKAIRGDASDNIPGCCKGVGEKSVLDFIDLLYLFRDSNGNWDFNKYPDNIDDLKSLCNENNISYKKAYLNFDKDRFFINLELVDLNKVEVPQDIEDSIISVISDCKSHMNYFSAAKMLADLEINNISIDTIIENVSLRYRFLLKEG